MDSYVEPLSTKVTCIAGKYHCRLFNNGVLVSEIQCDLKQDIGWSCREMLRRQSKLGSISRFAEAARERQMKTPNPVGKYMWVVQ
jgi:hypothetical protein